MRLKKDKYQILTEITNVARVNLDPYSMGNSPKQAIENAINIAIYNAFNVLLDNVYTDEEFEKDLTIRK